MILDEQNVHLHKDAGRLECHFLMRHWWGTGWINTWVQPLSHMQWQDVKDMQCLPHEPKLHPPKSNGLNRAKSGWIDLGSTWFHMVPHGSTDFDGSTWNLGASAHCITVTAVAKAFQLDQRRPRLWAEWKLLVRCHNCAAQWRDLLYVITWTQSHTHTFHGIMMYYENVM